MMTINKILLNDIPKIASQLTSDCTFPPIPVVEIASVNDVNIIFSQFNDHKNEVSGFCDFENIFQHPSYIDIYINTIETPERQLFTLAYEFGHWMVNKDHFLKHKDQYKFLPRFNLGNNDEFGKRAYRFAVSLLIPTHLLNPVRNARIEKLCHVFSVSRLMMEDRLKNSREYE